MLCPGCGLPRDESTAPDHEFDYVAEPVACHACRTREQAARKWSRQDGADTAGIYWPVRERG